MDDSNKDKAPLEPASDNPSLNSRLHAATTIQSSVKPEDYPEEKRAMQTASSRLPPKGALSRGQGPGAKDSKEKG